MYKRYIKRLIDLCLSVIAFIILIPVYFIIALLVRIKIGSPVFFKQERATINGNSFYIKKFRTMTEAKDEKGNYLPDNERLTYFGRILRATSLDELPEIMSIIKGELSIIGPRPLPVAYNDYYTIDEKSRFKVRAGLIPPEVLYENLEPTWDEQLKYESDYAENVSFLLDVKILIAVFKGIFIRYKSDYGDYVREPLNIERKGELH
ncbi:MAG: sugar transferase [Tyzzerella sp.]|uniref:Sugar transferase n=1 Tax=Candidatus Fimicola merdigallinarum TaxID=2840819 RepID=A0A9D9DWK8_9FIRM|nr:sugar transferase [Candidatus Fimicola merdigallinarum]